MVFKLLKIHFNSNSLEKKLAEIRKNSDEIAHEVVEQVGSLVKTNARHYVPVDTGALRASIDMEVNGNEAEIGTPLEYAPFVEYGTRSQAPQPFLTLALREAESKTDAILKSVVSKYVND